MLDRVSYANKLGKYGVLILKLLAIGSIWKGNPIDSFNSSITFSMATSIRFSTVRHVKHIKYWQIDFSVHSSNSSGKYQGVEHLNSVSITEMIYNKVLKLSGQAIESSTQADL